MLIDGVEATGNRAAKQAVACIHGFGNDPTLSKKKSAKKAACMANVYI